jgi:transposase
MAKVFLGIDISKAHFDVALLNDGKMKTKKFENDSSGYKALSAWLLKANVEDLHACMEATGTYGEALATYLHEQRIAISVVNPAQIKGFSLGELGRTKTDNADAKLIARFCQAMNPSLWEPKPLYIRKLQAWVRRLESLQKMLRQEENRLDVSDHDVVISINDGIAFLMKEINKTKKTIKRIIEEVPDLQRKKKLLLTIPLAIEIANIPKI